MEIWARELQRDVRWTRWLHNDGSHGVDTFNADGSITGQVNLMEHISYTLRWHGNVGDDSGGVGNPAKCSFQIASPSIHYAAAPCFLGCFLDTLFDAFLRPLPFDNQGDIRYCGCPMAV